MSKKAFLALALALAASAFAPCRAEEITLYVPIVRVKTFQGPINGHIFSIWWISSLSGFNTASQIGSLSYIAAYGPGAAIRDPAAGCVFPGPLLPLGGTYLERTQGCLDRPTGGPGFLQVSVTPGLVLNAEIERFVYPHECPDIGPFPISQGRTPLPVYRGLFPAGANVVSGDIDLGDVGHPEFDCLTKDQQRLRRVNLTLFNGGTQPATFRVVLRPILSDGQSILWEETYQLGPKEVRQFNRLPIPPLPNEMIFDGVSSRVWMNITADQPFLSYVSTIFDTAEPGTMPFEVIPSRLAN